MVNYIKKNPQKNIKLFNLGLVFTPLLNSNLSVVKNFILGPTQLVKPWEAMIPDELLRKDVFLLTKVSDYFTVKHIRLDDFNSHFRIEKGKSRAQVYLKSLAGRQTHVGPVFRNQQSSLGYEDFFNKGMTLKGTHDNLLMHTESNTITGNFIFTTLNKDIPAFGRLSTLTSWSSPRNLGTDFDQL